YLQVDTTVYERFKGAYVSGTYEPVTQLAAATAASPPVVPYTAVNGIGLLAQQRLEAMNKRDQPSEDELADTAVDVSEPTVLDVIVERLASSRLSVHKVWIDPMPTSFPLDRVLKPLLQRGARRPFPVGSVLGIIDEPRLQRQRPFLVDFAGQYGNLLVVGAPQSGKSM